MVARRLIVASVAVAAAIVSVSSAAAKPDYSNAVHAAMYDHLCYDRNGRRQVEAHSSTSDWGMVLCTQLWPGGTYGDFYAGLRLYWHSYPEPGLTRVGDHPLVNGGPEEPILR